MSKQVAAEMANISPTEAQRLLGGPVIGEVPFQWQFSVFLKLPQRACADFPWS
jgi:hypothetical protein